MNGRIFLHKDSTTQMLIPKIKEEAPVWCLAGAKYLKGCLLTIHHSPRVKFGGHRSTAAVWLLAAATYSMLIVSWWVWWTKHQPQSAVRTPLWWQAAARHQTALK